MGQLCRLVWATGPWVRGVPLLSVVWGRREPLKTVEHSGKWKEPGESSDGRAGVLVGPLGQECEVSASAGCGGRAQTPLAPRAFFPRYSELLPGQQVRQLFLTTELWEGSDFKEKHLYSN